MTPDRDIRLASIMPPSDQDYAVIGKIEVNWSVLELLMDSLVWKLANVADFEGACLTAQFPNTARRIDALISLIRLNKCQEELVKRYHKFSDRTQTLQLRRNRVTHDPWARDVTTGDLHSFEVTASKKLEFGYKKIDFDVLMRLLNDITEHIDNFDMLAKETISAIDTSRRERFEAYKASLPPDQKHNNDRSQADVTIPPQSSQA